MTSEVLKQDAYALEAMPCHLAAALELRKKNDLFLLSHRSGPHAGSGMQTSLCAL